MEVEIIFVARSDQKYCSAQPDLSLITVGFLNACSGDGHAQNIAMACYICTSFFQIILRGQKFNTFFKSGVGFTLHI